MRHIVLLSLLALSACGAEPEREEADSSLSTFDIAEQAPAGSGRTASGPSIAPTAAPGVAFNYNYAFRMPANRIASVQEQHSQACEKLGVNRCRITGMRYRLVNENDIEGMLAFKLEPAIARQFGKAGVEAVVNAEGMLIESAISGEDAGAAIKTADRTEAQLAADLRRVEEQLARRGLSDEERLRLQNEAEELRRSIRATRDTREDQRESLANTPVTFHYGSGDLVPGFDTRSPLRNAFEQAGNNLIGGIAFLLVLIVSLLPWVVIGWLGWLAARRWLPTPRKRRSEVTEPDQGAAPAPGD
jgi:hypothetical protein